MSTNNFNYSEAFCDAVDILISKRLEGQSYDITKVCTITDDSQKRLGKYIVQEDNVKYEVYSINTTFTIGDSVLVSIPNGDYTMQKTILNKVVIGDDLKESAAYISPLSQMLDFTGDIIQDTEREFSLLANNEKRTMTLIHSIDWKSSGDDSYSDYTRMGISVDFQSWLNEYNVKSGDYGLQFFFYKKGTPIADIENHTNSVFNYVLSANDMLGNPYEFETYYEQEKVFDISFIQDIGQVDIYFYQNNDFKNENNELIPYLNNEIDNEFTDIIVNELNDNLFVNNLKIYLGYDSNAFSGDTLILSSTDLYSYSKMRRGRNNKNLILKWIHKVDDNTYKRLSEEDTDVTLYWVRQGESDPEIESIVGAGWTRSHLSTDNNKFKSNFNIDESLDGELTINVKVVGIITQKDGNQLEYTSNIITFRSEDPVVDNTTKDVIMGLSFKCMDNSEGNYFLYNQNSEIINKGQGQGYLRRLDLYFNGISLLDDNCSLSNKISYIKWTLPYNTENNETYTMLSYSEDFLTDDTIIISGNTITKTYNSADNPSLYYYISDVWYYNKSHNTISCEVLTNDGLQYNYSKEFIFGKANSQGSNLRLDLQYINDKNACEVIIDSNNTILGMNQKTQIKGVVYDLQGKLVNIKSSWNIALTTYNGIFQIEGSTSYSGENFYKGITVPLILSNNSIGNILNKNCYHVLTVTYNQLNENNEITLSLTAQMPLAIKTFINSSLGNNTLQASCQSMEGAREIIYNAQGVPQYYTDVYQLRDNMNNIIQNINWSCTDDQNGPTLKTLQNGVALSARPVFVRNYNYHTCICAKQNNLIFWIQPILIMQSAYDFAIINDWDGTTEMTEETIMSSVIAAGTTNENGKFSGIIMGEVFGGTSESQKKKAKTESVLGLYGVSDGNISFSMTENGLATFQKDAALVLLGNDNLILCCDETINHIPPDSSNLPLGNHTGCSDLLLFDIDQRTLTLSSNGTDKKGIYMSPYGSTGNYLTLGLGDNNNLLTFNDTTFQLKSPASAPHLTIDLVNGIIELSKNSSIGGNNNLLNVGKLKIDSNGEVYYNNSTLTNYINQLIQNAVDKYLPTA